MTTVAPDTDRGIRRAVRADLLDVVRIERAAFSHPWDVDAFEQFVGQPGFLVAESPGGGGAVGGDVVGYVVATGVQVNGTPMGHVKDLAVDPDHRGRGLGSTLLDRGLSILAGRGHDGVRLEVRESNETAIDLYRGFDFSIVRRYPGYYPDGEDAFLMVADVSDREEY
ncbi:MAG: GNAT family N-acetyltransferase [Halanaeroarchaeum sp.]